MSPEDQAEMDERLGALYHAMGTEVERLQARLSVIERALEAVIGDVDAILMAVSEEPEEARPGVGYPEFFEEVESAPQSAVDLDAMAEQANETPAAERDGDLNSIVEVPEEGIVVSPGRPEPKMRRHRSA